MKSPLTIDEERPIDRSIERQIPREQAWYPDEAYTESMRHLIVERQRNWDRIDELSREVLRLNLLLANHGIEVE